MAHHSDLIAENIEEYLHQHEHKDLLRFITCGSVDDGKSTLIGRLLHDSKMIFEDQLAAITKESQSIGKAGEGELDLALLVDGLASEREQGITIDVAYRFFSTEQRKFIIADTPGHEQYTRNMATGASTAHLAVILIDARKGVLTQTRRHSFICSLLGIKNVVVAVNKMDAVDYSQQVFEDIQADYLEFAAQLNIPEIKFIPLSALKGDNVVNKSDKLSWFEGPTMMSWLNSVEIIDAAQFEGARIPVQTVIRPDLDYRGFAGPLRNGPLKVGDTLISYPSGKSSKVKSIHVAGELADQAVTGQPVVVALEDEIDCSRGDMLANGTSPVLAKRVDVNLIWMSDKRLTPGKEYLIKCGTLTTPGRIENIEYRVDINTLEHNRVNVLGLNEIARCVLNTNDAVIFDAYDKLRSTGNFIVIDRLTNITVGAGMLLGKTAADMRHGGREYSDAEVALNHYIREHFPEWGCKEI
jgi:sulfate adenylyltransferase large subunit